MKTHELNFSFLSNSILFGMEISQYEKRNKETKLFHPILEIKTGFIFFTISYRNTNYTIGKK